MVPLYAAGEVTPEQLDLAVGAFDEHPVDERRWFFGAGDLPRWFGYRLGYQMVSKRIAALGSDAAALVNEPTRPFSGPRAGDTERDG